MSHPLYSDGALGLSWHADFCFMLTSAGHYRGPGMKRLRGLLGPALAFLCRTAGKRLLIIHLVVRIIQTGFHDGLEAV